MSNLPPKLQWSSLIGSPHDAIVPCVYCGKVFTRGEMEPHHAVCEMHPMECPAQCGAQGLIRSTVEKHVTEDCPKTFVACPCARSGIIERGLLRRRLEEGRITSLEKQNLLSEETIQQLLRNRDEDRAKVCALEASSAEFVRRIQQLERALEEANRQQSAHIASLRLDRIGLEREQSIPSHTTPLGSVQVVLAVLENAPERFDSLSQELARAITSEEILKGTIDLVFEKSLLEPKFSQLYANLCSRLSTYPFSFLPPESMPTAQGVVDIKRSVFRRLLLHKCQQEFESGCDPMRNVSEEKKAQMTDREKDALSLKMRNRLKGNMKFIGELFLNGQLAAGIIHRCCIALLKADPPESLVANENLEAVSTLLTVVGKVLETKESSSYMEGYMTRMQQIIDTPSVESRIRSMLMEVIDLRRRGWQPQGDAPSPPGVIPTRSTLPM